MQQNALTIYQDWLDATAPAILTNDLEVLANHIALPYRHQAGGASVIIETREDLDYGQTTFANSLRANGVNHFIRLAQNAEFLSTDYIEGHHRTHILSNARRVVPSFTDRMVLRRFAERWKMVELSVPQNSASWPVKVLRRNAIEDALPEQSDEDARRGPMEPLAIYQGVLDKLDQSNAARDFSGFAALFSYPCTFHTSSRDHHIATRGDMATVFEGIQTMLDTNKVDCLTRTGTLAEFISGNEILGYHTSRFLKDGEDVLDPLRTRLILHRTGTDWRCRSFTNSVENEHLPYEKPVLSKTLVTQREIQERTKKWPTSH